MKTGSAHLKRSRLPFSLVRFVLRLADISKPLRVDTDASDTALGGVLLEEFDQDWHPMACAIRKLTTAEKSYTIMEWETLTVVFAINAWRQYLIKHFDIFTENQAAVYLKFKRGHA